MMVKGRSVDVATGLGIRLGLGIVLGLDG